MGGRQSRACVEGNGAASTPAATQQGQGPTVQVRATDDLIEKIRQRQGVEGNGTEGGGMSSEEFERQKDKLRAATAAMERKDQEAVGQLFAMEKNKQSETLALLDQVLGATQAARLQQALECRGEEAAVMACLKQSTRGDGGAACREAVQALDACVRKAVAS